MLIEGGNNNNCRKCEGLIHFERKDLCHKCKLDIISIERDKKIDQILKKKKIWEFWK